MVFKGSIVNLATREWILDTNSGIHLCGFR